MTKHQSLVAEQCLISCW